MPTPVLTPEHRLVWSRDEAGYSQSELAELLGVSLKTIGNWETGRTAMPVAVYRAWAHACDVEYDWLVGALPTESIPTTLERRRRAGSGDAPPVRAARRSRRTDRQRQAAEQGTPRDLQIVESTWTRSRREESDRIRGRRRRRSLALNAGSNPKFTRL